MKIKAAAMIVGAAASIGLAGTAFAHGKPSVHTKTATTNKQCDLSIACGNLNRDLDNSLNGDLDGNHVNVLDGNLNHNKVLSGNNVNAPVTIAPDFCGSPIGVLSGLQVGVCKGNYHPVNAGQQITKTTKTTKTTKAKKHKK
jgi:hypothetical protein